MGLTLTERRAVTKTIATRYARADKVGKGRILDELCATTGWHRNHARKALKAALRPRIAKPRPPRAPKYGPKVIAALIFCWAVLGMPAGKRLAPMLGELVEKTRLQGPYRGEGVQEIRHRHDSTPPRRAPRGGLRRGQGDPR
jgi:hypothetical protein